MEIIHDVDQPRQETRTCRICNEVGHLARNCPQAPPREETRKCHVCGEVGHLARNCPNAEDGGDYDGGEGAGGRRRKGAGGRRCFNCGQVGHLSADCDLPPGNTACYNCGQQGHKSSECPN